MTPAYSRFSIRTQILLLALAIVLPVALMLAWFLFNDVRYARENAHARVRILADNAAAGIERQLRQAEETLGRLAVRPRVRTLDPRNCDPIVAEYVALNPEYTTLALRDVHGNIICSYVPRPIPRLNPQDFPWFEEGLRTGRFTVGDAFLGRQSGRWVSVLTYPVRDDAGTVTGLLALPVDLLKLGQQVLGSVPRNAIITVTDRQGTILLRSADGAAFIGKPSPTLADKAPRNAREGFLSVTGPDGVRRLETLLTIPGLGWGVVAGVPEAEAYADYHATLKRTLEIGLGILLLALALAWGIGTAIVRPIAQLAGTATRVAAGDNAARASVSGPAEIRSVAQQFNSMLDTRDSSEAALLKLKNQLAATLDAVPDLLFQMGLDGRYYDYHSPRTALLAAPAEELIGRTVSDILPPDAAATVMEALREAHETGASFGRQICLPLAQGESWFELSVSRESSAAGQEPRFVVLSREITERKLTEQALRDSERRLRAIIDTEPECVKVVDRNGQLREMNAAGLAMLEADSMVTVQQRPLLDYLAPEYRDAFAALHRRVMNGEGGILEFEVVGLKGTRRWLETHAAPMRNAAGGVDMLLGITRDITARKRFDDERALLEAQLRESQKMEAIGTLAGGIAHDFNNIIGTILGNAELARHDAGANSSALDSLEEIRKAGQRARDLVQQILSFSRRQTTERRVIGPGAVVADAVRLLRSTLPARVQIESNVAPDAPQVMADPTQIVQVLLNLGVNAAHAMSGRPGRIDIGVAPEALDAAAARLLSKDLQPGAYVRVCVSDDGDGMDAATVARIFEPFFTTKPVGEGTGLGLSVVHGIVRAHEGAIVVRSEPGKGSRFDLYFPAAQGAPAAAGAAAGALPPAQGRGQEVLYIDDDEALVFLVTRLLQRRGYRVSGYVEQSAALAALTADPARFQLVVTDYNMPGMSGLDVVRAVRNIRPDLPVAVASGFITDELKAQAAAAGVHNIIFKANAAEEFCDVVQRLVPAPAG